MKTTYSLLFTIAAGIIVLVACNGKAQDNAVIPEDTIPVKIIELQQQSSQAPIQASGQFTTDDETSLSFKTGGIVNRIFVKEGDAVTKGQVLATLNLTEISAQVQQATLSYEKAKRDYERANALYKDSVSTLEQLQNSKTALDVAAQQLEAVKFNRAYSEIRAGTSGFVLKKFVNEGQYLSAGTAVVQINGAHKGDWILKVGVSDKQWSAIKNGDKATVQTDALPGKTFDAYVSSKPEGVDPQTGTFVIQVKLKSSDVPVSFAAGLFGKATITPSQKVTAWNIPYDALLDGDAGQGYVFVTNDYKTAVKVPVKIVGIDNGKVLIQDGLENAKALIVSGSAYLDDKSAIKVMK